MNGTAIDAGIQFGPTANGNTYLATYKHRDKGPKNVKSCWAEDLDPAEEYIIFEAADTGEVAEQRGNMWGVRDKEGSALGPRRSGWRSSHSMRWRPPPGTASRSRRWAVGRASAPKTS